MNCNRGVTPRSSLIFTFLNYFIKFPNYTLRGGLQVSWCGKIKFWKVTIFLESANILCWEKHSGQGGRRDFARNMANEVKSGMETSFYITYGKRLV